MSHKYLKDLGFSERDLCWEWLKNDSRQIQWKKERRIYGFDERETWNLQTTLTELIYERLKWYRENAPIEMDKLDFSHTYEVDGKKYPYGEIIDRILKSFALRLQQDDHKLTDEQLKEFEKCWSLLGIIYWSLWW